MQNSQHATTWLYLLAVTLMVATGSHCSAAPTPPHPNPHTPNWVLQNGVWVPVVVPGKVSPPAQVAAMIYQLKTGHPGRVVHLAKKWLRHHKKDPLVPQVLLLEGDAQNNMGNKYAALFPYENLLDDFPASPLYEPCLKREYDIACAFLAGYKRRLLGLRILPVNGDALKLLRRIQDRQRGSPLAELAGIRVADYYYNDGRFQRALASYTNFLQRYPYSQFAVKATMRKAECSLATFRGVLFDLTPLRNAEAELENIAELYPVIAAKMQVKTLEERIYQIEGNRELEIARFYWRFSRPKSSAYYYRRVIHGWPDTLWAQTAQKEYAIRFPRHQEKPR